VPALGAQPGKFSAVGSKSSLGKGWTRIPTRQDAVALRNQIRVVICMFRHVRLAGQDPLHGQLFTSRRARTLSEDAFEGTTNGEDWRLQTHGIGLRGTSVSF
jgi:hypothetical protein